MKYVLKICGTAVLLSPLLYLLILAALSLLPGYQVPDLIGLMLIIYILPYTLLFNILSAGCIFVMTLSLYSFAKARTVKIILSLLSTIIIFLAFKLLFIFDPNNIYVDDYLLAAVISFALIFFIWYYDLDALYKIEEAN